MNPLYAYAGSDMFPFLAGAGAAFIFPVLIVLALWSIAIKGLALWHAARSGQMVWFLALLVVNTLGILELVYLLAFRTNTTEPLIGKAASVAS